MVALWQLACLVGVPNDVLTYQKAIKWGAGVRRGSVDAGWWGNANVVDHRRPWSSLAAAEVALGVGRMIVPRLVSASMPAPSLTPGRWHVIQRWIDPGALKSGHTYLVHAGPTPADPVMVLQSSEAKRLRVTPGSWDGTAGLTGYHVGAVVLPRMEAS